MMFLATAYEAWWRLAVGQLGIPGAMMLVVVFAFWKGWIVPGWAIAREREATLREREATQREREVITDRNKECEIIKAELKEERQRYRELLLEHRDLTKRAVDATTVAAKAIPTQGS